MDVDEGASYGVVTLEVPAGQDYGFGVDYNNDCGSSKRQFFALLLDADLHAKYGSLFGDGKLTLPNVSVQLNDGLGQWPLVGHPDSHGSVNFINMDA